MQEGNKMFYDYMMECVKETHREQANKLLLDSFKKQEDGTFKEEDMQMFEKEIIELLKPEKKVEVMAIMKQFRNDHIS